MNAPESLVTVSEESLEGQTVTFSSVLEKSELVSLPREELLVEANRSDEYQTNMIHPNGDSFTLDARPRQIVFIPPPLLPVREHFVTIQKWEGYVTDLYGEIFRARLIPIVGEGLDQEAEIYLDEVKPEDRSLIQLGSVFYWSIGYLDRPSGRLRASILRFRRLPTWTREELDQAAAEAEELAGLLGMD